MDYNEFLQTKQLRLFNVGKEIPIDTIHSMLFAFQKDVVKWAVHKGRAAVFLDTGLGKTFIQLEWARLINENTLIIAPLSVARQTVREAKKIDIDLKYIRSEGEIDSNHKLWITNYEMAIDFDMSLFNTVVLDESSILKSLGSKTRKKLTKNCENIKYRLCCSATPAPNDYIELGNHAHFLGICTMAEMLSMFFINANKEHTFVLDNKMYRKKGSNKGGVEWRLKHHAENAFFEWLSSWAMTMIKPSNLGYDDKGFILPRLNIKPVFVHVDYQPKDELFFTQLRGLENRADIRRESISERLSALENIINGSGDQWIVWTGLNEESKAVHNCLDDSIEVKGGDNLEYKSKAFEDFQDGKYRILITKPRIGGFGMNFQNAHNMIFFGLNDSWETYYQCIRRQWRYMQEKPVNVYIVISELETEIYRNVMRKDAQAKRLRLKMIERIKDYEKRELGMTIKIASEYKERTEKGENWIAMQGDSCKRLKEIEDDSIDLSVYSPPFVDLYTYSPSNRDLGNNKSSDEFFRHYSFIISEMLRVTKPGRLTCVHSSDIPAIAQKDGYIGIKDFPGEIIRAHEKNGWVFYGRAFVQKNPQAQAIRVKSKALLFVQMRKDSSDSRPALIDQILIFKKPGDNAVPITPVDNKELDNEMWIEWAHGIWLGIRETETLQYTTARDRDDEKHICPLQLGTIERCIKLYSNRGETVLTPFGGIGSEGYMAIKLRRKAILIELKNSYYEILLKNMKKIEADNNPLFNPNWS